MAEESGPAVVRPLTRISRATVVVMLLSGGLVGFFFGLPTAEPRVAEPDVTPATAAPFAAAAIPTPIPASYDWTEQKRTESVLQAWGVFAAADLKGVMYLLVFANVDSPEDRVLWRSEDGEEWTEIALEFGDAIVDDLDIYGDTLLLSGWLDGAPALWRSQPLPTDNPTWDVTRLGAADQSVGEIRFLDSSVQTEVSEEGELVVAVRTQSDLTPLLLNFAADPVATSILQLPDQPLVAAGGQRIWAQVVSSTGTESVHSVQLPSTTVLEPASGAYARDIGLITSGSIWASSDGMTFEAVDLAALPRVAYPTAHGDSFAAAIEDHSGRHWLWTSPDGVAWDRSDAIPPSECGGWESLVIGGPGMLLIDSTFETTCISTDGVDWDVRNSTQTVVRPPGQFWIDGTASGFIALARGASDLTVLVSENGHEWRPIRFATGLLGTHAFLVGDRLVTNAMTYGPPPLGRHFSVWVGDPVGE